MMGSSPSSDAWAQTYNQIKSKHDQAYSVIQEAITLEEQERPHEAIEMYKMGIRHIDESLGISVSCPEVTDSTWSDACKMIQKLKRTRGEVLTRITCIQNSPTYTSMHEGPPSYDEAMSTSSVASSVNGDLPRTYTELAAALENLRVDSTDGTAEVILSVDDVRMYFISPDGTVVSTSEQPDTLTIATLGDGGAFLQVGDDWVYPLVAGVSPCVRTEYGAFIVPDVNASVPGSSVGIIVPEASYETVYDLLENILHGIVDTSAPTLPERMRRDIPEQPSIDPTSSTVSSAIITGANYISKGLIFGAEKAASLINYGTPRVIERIAPASEATPVNRNVTRGFQLARTATDKAACATGFVADKVGLATARLGQYLAPHVQRQGTKLLSTGFQLSESDASSKVSGVLAVAAGAVEGVATVYRGLEQSAGILGKNLKDNSVKVVRHRYGHAAGELSNETLTTVGNVVTIGQNVHILRPRKLVKNIAKSTVSHVNVNSNEIAGPSGVVLYGANGTKQDNKEKGDKEKVMFQEQEQTINSIMQSRATGDPDLDFSSDDLINFNWSNSNNSVEKR